MPSLLEIHEYANISKNEDGIYITTRYIQSAKHGSYILGGMVVLNINDNITDCLIKEVQSLLYYSETDMLYSNDIINFIDSYEVKIIVKLIEELRIQKLRINGLFRAIVFWLSPARKRAAEFVFHPSRMDFSC